MDRPDLTSTQPPQEAHAGVDWAGAPLELVCAAAGPTATRDADKTTVRSHNVGPAASIEWSEARSLLMIHLRVSGHE